MFSIVYGHSLMLLPAGHSPWTGLLMGWFWDAYAPCVVVLMFFFLSGWLQKTKCRVLYVNKFLFLAFPVLLWNLVQLIVDRGVTAWSLRDLFSLGIWPTFTEADKPLWFLDELAWFSLLLPLIHRMPVLLRGVLVLAGMVTLYLLNPQGEIVWNPYQKFCADCLFFLMGSLISGLERARITAFFLKIAPWVFIVGTCYMWRSILYVNHWTPIPSHSMPYAFAGLICLLSYGAVLERFLPRLARWVSMLAPAVFFIYAAHWPMFTLWGKVEDLVGLCRLNEYLYPLYTVGCFALCAVACFFARKHLPGKLLEWFFLYKKPRVKRSDAL